MDLTEGQKAELVLIHSTGLSLRACCDELKRRYPGIRKPAKSTVMVYKERLLRTGSVAKSKTRNRNNTVTTSALEADISQIMHGRPRTSIRKLAQQVNVSYASARRTLKRLNFRPYKLFETESTQFRMPSKEEVREVLSVLDTNKDGKVSAEELKAFLDKADCKLDKKAVQEFIASHDKDKDGKLDLNELIACLSCC